MVTLGYLDLFFTKVKFGLLKGGKGETLYFFQNNGTLIWKKVLHAICEYQRTRSFSDLRQRRLGLNVLTFSNDFSSETARPFSIKFHMQHPGNGKWKNCSNGPGLMAKMATMPIYGKNFVLQNRRRDYLETWYVALGDWVLPSLFKWWP